MKIPCELIVWYVLPNIRRELAKELVEGHGLTQAEVARRFGVTDAAISQYLKKKRGANQEMEESIGYDEFKRQIQISAERIVNKGVDIVQETCRICGIVKQSGMLARIYEVQMGYTPPACVCPSNDDSPINW